MWQQSWKVCVSIAKRSCSHFVEPWRWFLVLCRWKRLFFPLPSIFLQAFCYLTISISRVKWGNMVWKFPDLPKCKLKWARTSIHDFHSPDNLQFTWIFFPGMLRFCFKFSSLFWYLQPHSVMLTASRHQHLSLPSKTSISMDVWNPYGDYTISQTSDSD